MDASYETIFPSNQFLAFCQHHVRKYLVLSKDADISWLEYGCGSGSAVTYALQTFSDIKNIHLLDVSAMALSITQSRFQQIANVHEKNISSHLLLPNKPDLPYPDQSISIVNAESSLYYNSYPEFLLSLHRIYDAMKVDGIARFYIKADDDRYCIPEFCIGDNTYQINIPGHWENSMVICCLSYELVQKHFSIFSQVLIGKESLGYTSINEQKSFWVVTVVK